MKDASATAIYGARANNGVLLVTTKTGKQARLIYPTNLSEALISAEQVMNI
ncbi:hypothetical protein OKW96_15375 [Sphingobacterium sp. KU25419]|nr:hypothetical protein OKW96_15375 [Sphingobacterium sp. KU25419]